MKKIDLHIHTVKSDSDADFTFSLDYFSRYVSELSLDCVAVTNHNLFDLNQFNRIKQRLEENGATVFPGIEINFEEGHLLLVADGSDLIGFDTKCKEVQSKINDPARDKLSVDELKTIFGNLESYLLIPHYNKSPSVSNDSIDRLDGQVVCGEVTSPGKFIRQKQDENDLTPVYFSDARMEEGRAFTSRQTLVSIGDITIETLKLAFKHRKVALSESDENTLFRATADGQQLHGGLNVIVGGRSSGKTYTLDSIEEGMGKQDVKYIRQFDLVKDDIAIDERFDKLLRTNRDTVKDNYINELRAVVDDVSQIDIRKDEQTIEDYLVSLKQYAHQQRLRDVYAKTKLYKEQLFAINPNHDEEVVKVIEAVELLLSSQTYSDLVNQYIEREQLKALFANLINVHVDMLMKQKKRQLVNSLIQEVQRRLSAQSSAAQLQPIDVVKLVKNRRKVELFERIVKSIKTPKSVFNKSVGDYVIDAKIVPIGGASVLKSISRSQMAFTGSFSYYSEPYKFLQSLISAGVAATDCYKYFVDIEYKILNKFGFPASGGERTEFILLTKIQDALKYGMLLIDEPESSFDSLFLLHSINTKLVEISKKIPVVIATHNPTVGLSIKPDYIVYTDRNISTGPEVDYRVFSGYPTSKFLYSSTNESVVTRDVMMNYFEAGESEYNMRGEMYEVLKDRE